MGAAARDIPTNVRAATEGNRLPLRRFFSLSAERGYWIRCRKSASQGAIQVWIIRKLGKRRTNDDSETPRLLPALRGLVGARRLRHDHWLRSSKRVGSQGPRLVGLPAS